MNIVHQFNFVEKGRYTLQSATFRERAIAQLIDGIILGAVCGMLYFILSGGEVYSIWVSPMIPQFLLEVNEAYLPEAGSAWWGGQFATVQMPYGRFVHIGYPSPLFYLIYGCYYTFFTARFGQTPGKMLKKLVVVGYNGHQITVLPSLLRWIGYALSLLPAGMGLWSGLLRLPYRTWHDRISRSEVLAFEKNI